MYGKSSGNYSQCFFMLAEVKFDESEWQFELKFIINEIGWIWWTFLRNFFMWKASGSNTSFGFFQHLLRSAPARLTLWFPYFIPSGFTNGMMTNWKFFLKRSNSVLSIKKSITPSKTNDEGVSPECCLAMNTILLVRFDVEASMSGPWLMKEFTLLELKLRVLCLSLDLKLSNNLSSVIFFNIKVLDLDFLW